MMTGPKDDEVLPIVETTREVIQFYNRTPQALEGFDRAGYFILEGVIVCEEGQRDAVIRKMSTSPDETKYGKKIT